MTALGRIATVIDRINEAVGRFLAIVVLVMVLTVFAVVVLRYAFDIGWVAMQEAYVWMHGLVLMLGAAYTLKHDGHVRVDIVYRGKGDRYRAVVDIAGTVFLLFPVMAVVIHVSWEYVADSWSRMEASREAGGLPGLFLLKSAILAFAALMALQGLALVLRSASLLFRPRPGDAPDIRKRA